MWDWLAELFGCVCAVVVDVQFVIDFYAYLCFFMLCACVVLYAISFVLLFLFGIDCLLIRICIKCINYLLCTNKVDFDYFQILCPKQAWVWHMIDIIYWFFLPLDMIGYIKKKMLCHHTVTVANICYECVSYFLSIALCWFRELYISYVQFPKKNIGCQG